MKRWSVARSFVFVILATMLTGTSAAAQGQGPDGQGPPGQARKVGGAALTLPVTGTASGGGAFTGTLAVQRFARSGNQLVAVGIVTGTVAPDPTILIVGVEVPVTVSQASAGLEPSGGTIRPASGMPPERPRGFMLVQATCGVLHLEFGAITLNVLGLVVTTTPIAVDISGETGGTNLLGTLVCQILTLGTGAVNLLVGLLNQLLGLLGGLTGGLSA